MQLKTEYLLKGIFLGLVVYAALLQVGAPSSGTYADTLAPINLTALAGVGVALLLAAVVKLRQGYRARGRPLSFVLFLLLESPLLVYAGVLGGLLGGLYLNNYLHDLPLNTDLLLPCLGGGAALGVVFMLLRGIRKTEARLVAVFLVNAALAVGLLVWLTYDRPPADLTRFALQMLLGIPFFYLLTFTGQEEESEVEIGACCGLLGVGLWVLTYGQVQYQSFGYFLPLLLYIFYAIRVLPWLRVVKHAFRGMSHAAVGRYREALTAFRRALRLDPNNALAREGFWRVHRALDFEQLHNDPELLNLVDFDLCVERAGSLLVAGKPTADRMSEARRLLQLVLSQRADLAPAVEYWRAVADLHDQRYDEAETGLRNVLDPAHFGRDNPARRDVLMSAWRLALLLHPEMQRRVGEPEIAKPGRRMEAIAAVERHLAAAPNDGDAWGLKRLLYRDLSEDEYRQAAAEGQRPAFDHAYAAQLGLGLITDAEKWKRGAEYLRLAAEGLSMQATSLFVEIAKAQQRAGLDAESIPTFELARQAGRAVGPKNLSEAERKAYFATVKYLGDYALFHGDVIAALENYHLFTESENSGVETYRTLAELYEKKGDPLAAARATDQGLIYNPKDSDLLAKKGRYYYSITPEQLRERVDQVRVSFDTAYCLNEAKSILDGRRSDDLEWLDVAKHLLTLAAIVDPLSLTAKVLAARVRLRYGERDEAIAALEAVRTPKPEKFAGKEDEDAWFVSCQLLGDLYMETDRADLAVPCYNDFRKSVRSGAKTYFKLAQAYEKLGDAARAVKCYKQVAAYDGNPLAPDANDAISRLQQASRS
jgi:tetratricopeptide (TPR) repeat protein